MDTKKTGSLLRELRKEQGMTQEQLAEKLGVAGRTVSRWETGSNIPDLDILIELADMYQVDIRELIDGKRKGETMDAEMKDTLIKVGDYKDEERKILAAGMGDFSLSAILFLASYLLLEVSGMSELSPRYEALSGFLLGLVTSILLMNTLYCFGILDKARAAKLAWMQKRRGQFGTDRNHRLMKPHPGLFKFVLGAALGLWLVVLALWGLHHFGLLDEFLAIKKTFLPWLR